MGQGYIRNDGANNIANGNVIDASDLDGEFDAVVAAFASATGHSHDGTTAEGGVITVVGPAQEYVSSGTSFHPKTDGIYDLGSATNEWKDLYVDGIAYIDAVDLAGVSITATGTELNYMDGVTSAVQTQLDAKQASDADLTAIAALANTDGNFIVGNGTAWVAESGATVRTSLGLGTAATTASTDYATAAQGTTADAALPKAGGTMTGNITMPALGTVDGRDLSVDGTKLDGIEALADVTDVTNVTAAGALMDSEVTNLTQVKAFDTTDYATAAQGTTADAALPKTGGAMTGAITTNSTFDGRDVATDGTKLDGIEALADVTDTANVTAAGALMDSEVDADIKTLVLPASTTISTFGASLIDDAAASNARTTLGLGTIATVAAPSGTVVGTTDTQTLTAKTLTNVVVDGSVTEEVFAVTGTTPALDPVNGTIQTWTLTANSTPTESFSAGESMTLMIDDGTAYTITWPTMKWSGGSAPTLATTDYSVIVLWKVGTTLYGSSVGDMS